MAEPKPDRHLYVIGDASEHLRFLNCERIADRSHIHRWQVAPHYHEGLVQIFCFVSGRVRGQVDYEAVDFSAPAVVWMPSLISHGFDYPPQMEGWVITLPSVGMARLAEAMAWLGPWLSRAAVLTGDDHREELSRLQNWFATIAREHDRSGEERDTMLDALLRLVLAELHRGFRRSGNWAGPIQSQHLNLVRQFQTLVDRDFTLQRSVANYAEELAVTPTHLSRTVKAYAGCTASEVIHDRLVLEARRLLVSTNVPIAQISNRLNFSTPSYFTRFYANRTRETPNEFRRRMQLSNADAG